MAKRKASETARLTSILRAVHQVVDAEPRILDDPLSVGLVKGSSAPEIEDRRDRFVEPRVLWTRSQVALRNRYAEDMLEAATRDGAGQYLMLGSGFDTFAYRQPPWTEDLAIVDVDHPESLDRKREALHQTDLPAPPNVEFCPIDLETRGLSDGLTASSFRVNRRTFVSWLGVTGYLSRSAIETVLRFVLGLPKGSGIVFTFVLPPAILEGIDRESIELGMQVARERGEPHLSHFEPSEMKEWLSELGFAHVVHLTPAEAQDRYFANRDDGLSAPSGAQLMCGYV